ncbi:MAG: LysM peptidoglycan-binding domain-containing protein [SAR324 cluster bacterium]
MGSARLRIGLRGAGLAALLVMVTGTACLAADAAPPKPENPSAVPGNLPDPNIPAVAPATGNTVSPEQQAPATGAGPAASEPPVSEPAASDAATSELPAAPEDSSLQDEIDEPAAEEQPPAESQPDATSAARVPKHGVPVPQGGERFPTSPVIDRQVAFWVHAFTAMDSHQGLLHDGRVIGPIYETIDLGDEMRMRQQNAFVKQRIRVLAARLNALADCVERNQPLGEDLERLRALLPADETPDRIRERVRYVRFQRGLSDRFRNGLVRSGSILEEVRRIMAEHGVPRDLAYLPHVESSFNNATLSRAGAAGIWQFTRGTGRLFLTVQSEVDERLDPVIAARAAAIFLKENYERLGTWPLAITAYNHGPQSMERIVAKTGTVDLGTLIGNYDGPLFKFASKNFYAEFLAARQVATHYRDYFGDLELDRPQTGTRVELPFFLDFDRAARALDIPRTELARLNSSLRPSVLTGAKFIPKGFRLKLPPQVSGQRFLAAVPDGARFSRQKISTEVRVARGDTLSAIGQRNGIPWPAIASANNLSARSRLYVGQRLILPRPGQAPVAPAIAAAQMASAGAAVAPDGAVPLHRVEGDSSRPNSPAPLLHTVENGQGDEARLREQPADSSVVSAFRNALVSDWMTPPQTVPATPGAIAVPVAAAPAGTGLPARDALTQPAASGQPSSPLVSGEALALREVDATRQEGVVRAAYGETVGHYADWAQIPAAEIRERNNMGASRALQPGRRVVIPLHAVTAEAFNSQRLAFHRAREASFFASYTVQDRVEVRLDRGQSVWALAQEHNVPMWLLYRENPSLLEHPVQAGMRVVVPQVQMTAATGR